MPRFSHPLYCLHHEWDPSTRLRLAYEHGIRHTPANVNGHLVIGVRRRCAYHTFSLDLKMLTALLHLCVNSRGNAGEKSYTSREIS